MKSVPRANRGLLEKIRERRGHIAKNLLNWSKAHSPKYPWRLNTSAYSILVSELLLRKTRSNKVAEIFPLFMEEFPSVNDLAAGSEDNLRRTIYPLGRINRYRTLMSIAEKITNDYSGQVPETEEELFRIIGKQSKYTVNAIRCFSFEQRVPVFDVNVNRIISRVFSIYLGKDAHKKQISWEIAENLLPSKNFKQFNWALLDLGRMVCTNNRPNCGMCPLQSYCDYAKRLWIKRD
jgi:A/G-specific adenine glycosylase